MHDDSFTYLLQLFTILSFLFREKYFNESEAILSFLELYMH